jgi:hypothetical protein
LRQIRDHPEFAHEFNMIHAAKGGGIPILLAARQAQIDPFDLIGQMRDFIGPERQIQQGANASTKATTRVEEEPSPEPGRASTDVRTVTASGLPPPNSTGIPLCQLMREDESAQRLFYELDSR